MRRLWVPLLLVLAACSEQSTPQVTVTPSLVGQVTIQSPQVGTTYYAETLVVGGASSELPSEGFTLTLLDSADNVLQTQTVVPVDNRWRLTIPFETSAATTITLRAEGTRGQGIYDEVTVGVGLLSERPQGTYALFYSPSQEQAVGGEEFEITGVASGLDGQSLDLIGINELGNTVFEMSISPDVLSPLDEVPFREDVPLDGITGALTLELRLGDVLYDKLLVLVGSAAG